MAGKKTKDLTPKSPAQIKGGKPYTGNDNVTLVRAAKPKVKGSDLTPKSPTKVKGGKLWLPANF